MFVCRDKTCIWIVRFSVYVYFYAPCITSSSCTYCQLYMQIMCCLLCTVKSVMLSPQNTPVKVSQSNLFCMGKGFLLLVANMLLYSFWLNKKTSIYTNNCLFVCVFFIYLICKTHNVRLNSEMLLNKIGCVNSKA